jgi:hypothetical protein
MRRLAPALVFVITLALGAALAPYGDVTPDETWAVFGAERVLAGELPHRDFLSVYPAAHYVVPALALKLGGGSLIAERIGWVTLRAVAAALACALAQRFAGVSSACAIAATFMLVPGAPHKAWCAVVPLAVASIFARWLEGDRKSLGWAGLACGVGCWFRQDAAIAALIGVLVVAGSRGGRSAVLTAIAGAALGGGLILAPFLLSMSPVDLIRQLTVDAISEGLPDAEELGRVTVAGRVLLAIPPWLLVGGAVWATRRGWRDRTTVEGGMLLLIGVFTLLSSSQALRGSGLLRTLQAAPLLLLALPLLVYTGRWPRRAWLVPLATCALAFAASRQDPLSVTYVQTPLRALLTAPLTVRGEVLYGTPTNIGRLQETATALRTHVRPDEGVLMLTPWRTAALLLEPRPNPTRLIRMRDKDAARMDLLLDAMHRGRLNWVIFPKAGMGISGNAERMLQLRWEKHPVGDAQLIRIGR